MKGDADLTAGYLGAATAILSGAASMSSGGGAGGGPNSTIRVGDQTFPAYR